MEFLPFPRRAQEKQSIIWRSEAWYSEAFWRDYIQILLCKCRCFRHKKRCAKNKVTDLPVTPSRSPRRLSPLQKEDVFFLGMMMCGDRESSLSREVLSWLPPSRWKRWKCQSFCGGAARKIKRKAAPRARLDSPLGRTTLRPSVLLAEMVGLSPPVASALRRTLCWPQQAARVGVANRGKK